MICQTNSPHFPMDDLELIKEKINIVDLISEYLPLKKAGVNYKTNCPFHQEKTPSFMVSPERQIWHCFGCGKGGDIFKFLIEKESLEFKEALEILAQRAGVLLKKSPDKKNKSDNLYLINQKAAQFYGYLLTTHPLGKTALNYLKKRGLTDKTIAEFGIGYAPLSWESLTKFLKKRGFSISDMVTSGLCVASRSGCYDRFRGRVVFPLIDQRGRILGFSGRILLEGEPKYINSPQTPIFDKGKFLLGLNLSKGSIKEKDEAIVVEGEMDMILSYQSGIRNVVASKGTALTEDQIELVKKYTKNLSLCFDTDLAGDSAARRGIEIADRLGMNIKVIKIEGSVKDPAETVLKDPQTWNLAVSLATPIYDYYLDSATKRYDLKLATSKKNISLELLPIWSKISDPLVKEHYIQKLSTLLQVKDEFIRQELINLSLPEFKLKEVLKTEKRSEEKDLSPKVFDRRRLLEEYLLALILHIPPTHIYIPNFPETLLTQEELKQIYVLLVLFLDSISFKGKAFKIVDFVKSVPAELVPSIDNLYLMQIDEKLEDKKIWQKEIETVILELKRMLIKSSLEKLTFQIKSAQEFGNIETLELLNRRFRDLSVKLKNL